MQLSENWQVSSRWVRIHTMGYGRCCRAGIRLAAYLLLLLIPLFSFAQSEERPFAVVVYAEGDRITLYRDGVLAQYDVLLDSVVGLPLFQGDLVQTDPGTYLELQTVPAGTLLKVAENTTFQLSALGEESGQGRVQLTYGRIRAKVQKVTGSAPFAIYGRGVVAGVRGTDFGYDLVAERGGATVPVTQVYCFEGAVEVSAAPSPAGETAGTEKTAASSIVIRADQMVSVAQLSGAAETAGPGEESTEPQPSFKTETLAPEIRSYWSTNDFQLERLSPQELKTRFPALPEATDGVGMSSVGSEAEPHAEGKGQSGEGTPAAQGDVAVPEMPLQPGELSPSTQYEPEIFATRTALRSAGIVTTVLGGIVELAGVGVRFAAENFVPATSSGTAEVVADALMGGGGLLLTGGITTYIVSLFVNK